jgi:hypothetical protein
LEVFRSYSWLLVADDVAFVECEIELLLVRFLFVGNFEWSFVFEDDNGEAERQDRVVVDEEVGDEGFSFKWSLWLLRRVCWERLGLRSFSWNSSSSSSSWLSESSVNTASDE